MNTLKLNLSDSQYLTVKINGETIKPDKQNGYIYRSDKSENVEVEISSVQKGIKISFWELFLDAIIGLFSSVTPDAISSKIIQFHGRVMLTADKVIDLFVTKGKVSAPVSCSDPDMEIIENKEIDDPAVERYNHIRKMSLIIFSLICLAVVAIVLLCIFVF